MVEVEGVAFHIVAGGEIIERHDAAVALSPGSERRIDGFEREFEGRPVPRPGDWSGTRVVPRAIEFWHGAKFRLHERWLYERGMEGDWTKRMLYP